MSGSGIGSGDMSLSGEEIHISGGTIKATGGEFAPGIGGGFADLSTTIDIIDGNIDAKGGIFGAGIGNGTEAKNGNVNISGGIIKATGGENAAGIGNGYYAEDGKINISGGIITSNGGYNAAGIGGSYEAESYGDINISRNTVIIAKGEGLSNHIGGGQNYEDTGSTINGTVNKNGGLIIEGNNGNLYSDVTLYENIKIEDGYKCIKNNIPCKC